MPTISGWKGTGVGIPFLAMAGATVDVTTRVAVTAVTRVEGVTVVVTVDALGERVTVAVMDNVDTEGGAVTVAAVTTDHAVTTKVET